MKNKGIMAGYGKYAKSGFLAMWPKIIKVWAWKFILVYTYIYIFIYYVFIPKFMSIGQLVGEIS